MVADAGLRLVLSLTLEPYLQLSTTSAAQGASALRIHHLRALPSHVLAPREANPGVALFYSTPCDLALRQAIRLVCVFYEMSSIGSSKRQALAMLSYGPSTSISDSALSRVLAAASA